MKSDKIEIPLCKWRIILLCLLLIGLVLLGLFVFFDADNFVNKLMGLLLTFSFLVVLVSHVCHIIYTISKLGLLIDEKGIVENTSICSIGLIDWKDIQKIKRVEIRSPRGLVINKLLVIKVRRKQFDKYIGKSKNWYQRFCMRLSIKFYNSPIVVDTFLLKCNFETVEEMIRLSFDKHKSLNNKWKM